ncbi:MAG: hypothetical protein OEX12_16260 [Gammaproteobacteria bacterium]|nr:hypothetical protein [Gammaproteobacteria bacterium]
MSKQIGNYWLVKLRLSIGAYEKSATHVVSADTKREAISLALENECHVEADYSEYPQKDACWDGNEFVYTMTSCEPLTAETNRYVDPEEVS